MRLFGQGFEQHRQTLAIDAMLRAMRQAIRKGYDCVLDECNLYAPEWGLFSSQAQMHGASVKFVLIKATPEECKARCEAAGGKSEDLARIDRLAEKYADWLKK